MRSSFRSNPIHCIRALALVAGLANSVSALAQEPLFRELGPPDLHALPQHAIASQPVSVNPRALHAPRIAIELFGETYIAQRTALERRGQGEQVWIGHLEGEPGDAVVLTRRGQRWSGFVQLGLETYRLSAGPGQGSRLLMLDLAALPADDAADLPDGDGADSAPAAAEGLEAGVTQHLLVVYTQGACDSADPANPGNDCAQLEADIVTAVADMNAAYAASGVGITMVLAGMARTTYAGTAASNALSHLAGTTDGNMDEVHALRNALGADIVSLVYRGEGCGIGYLNSSASTAFNVTDEPCLVGNRTMAHEIGHNQGAHHDRITAGAGTSGGYNFGFRRCNDTSADGTGAPHFRTILSYSCSGAPRVGRFSNPQVLYSGVPQGVDPAVDPARGAWNARTLNESATRVAGFRAAAPVNPPTAPAALVAAADGPDTIGLSWQDTSADETLFRLQSSPDESAWTTIATLAANAASHADNGLPPQTTRHYRVRAENDVGASAWSNIASATTGELPAVVEDLADADRPGTGTVSGSYLATHAAGGAVETITEAHSGGPPSRRKQAFEHAWDFDVFGGAGGVVVHIAAWVSGNEGARFWYSPDGGASRHTMFTVTAGGPGAVQTFSLPPGTSGAVRIGVNDASQDAGEPVDTLSVDHIVIASHTEVGSPPAAPSAMAVPGTTATTATLAFTDNAVDEFGFELRRGAGNPGGNCQAGTLVATLPASAGTGAVAHTDTGLAPATTYWFWARAFNGAGASACTAAVSATTAPAPAISLAASGYKDKGYKHVDLSWSGATTTQVDVWRDGALLATVPNSGAWHDNTGQKGTSPLRYRVCQAGGSACSAEVTVVF